MSGAAPAARSDGHQANRGLGWYWRRLRVMSVPEISHRLLRAADLAYLRVLPVRTRVHADLPAFCVTTHRFLPAPVTDTARLESARQHLLSGGLATRHVGWQWSEDPDIWHRDPDTGFVWPRRFFGGIDYRPGNPVGDIRLLWEPARLQQTLDLASLADHHPGTLRPVALALLRRQLCSWVEQNPPLRGPHYVSAMECGLRLIAVCYALDRARPWLMPDDPCRRAVAEIARSHAPLIARRLSLHSSRGNHTVAEAVALVHAGLLFPDLPGAQRWLRRGLSLLADEAHRQILPDGGGIEQALSYHVTNLELIGLTIKLLKQRTQPVPQALADALDRGNGFLAGIAWGGDQLPAVGDGDDGSALSPTQRPGFTQRPSVGQGARQYPAAGYTNVTLASQRCLQFLCDHGPLGMPPAFGHGHADALSVLVCVDRTPLLIDPGTGGYGGEPGRWRDYFRSTEAHNTVTVDGHDQAPPTGAFQWARNYQARLVEFMESDNGSGQLLMWHDGYAERGVYHWRAVRWDPAGWLLVEDLLQGNGVHHLATHWHTTRPVERSADDTVTLSAPRGPVSMTLLGGTVTTMRAQTSATAGWHSPHYACRAPANTIRLACKAQLPHRLTTVIRLGTASPGPETIEETHRWLNRHLP